MTLRAALLTTLMPVLSAATPPQPSAPLRKLLAEDWEYHLSHSPTYASVIGDRRWNDRWDDLTLAALDGERQHDVAFLEKLGKVAKGSFSEADRLDAELIGREHRERIEALGLGLQFLPMTHMGGLPEVSGQFPGVQNAGQL